MKVTVEVKNKHEAVALARACKEPEMRIYVIMIGLLLQLPTDRSRERVMMSLKNWIDERNT